MFTLQLKNNAERNALLAALRHYLEWDFGEPANRPYVIHALASGETGDGSREDISLDTEGLESLFARLDSDTLMAPAVPNAEGANMVAALEAGVMLARRAVENWASGDLSFAVNALEEWAEETADRFPHLDYSDGLEPDEEDDDESNAGGLEDDGRHALQVVVTGPNGRDYIAAIYPVEVATVTLAREAAEARANQLRTEPGAGAVRVWEVNAPESGDVTVRHVDTCLASYVLDHCNGEREALLGVAVDHESTYASVKADLIREWCELDLYGRTAPPDDSAVIDEIESEFAGAPDPSALFAPSLVAPAIGDESADTDESVYAWFRVSWETAD
jgi:hypothetical protein